MNVVLFGAGGMIGSRILKELIARGHKVTVVVRDPAKIPATANVRTVKGDALDVESIASATRGANAVISAYGPGAQDQQRLMEESTRALIAGVRKAGVKRFLMVGGAGSLLVAPGVDLIDSGHLPEE